MGSIVLVATINPGEGDWGLGSRARTIYLEINFTRSTSTHRRNSSPFFFPPQNSRLKTNFFFYLSNRTHVPPAPLRMYIDDMFFFFFSLEIVRIRYSFV